MKPRLLLWFLFSASVLAQTPGVFTSTGSMSTPRFSQTATLLPNGKVLVAGGITQTEEIHSGGSYLSQNDLRVHFGLNQATKIDSLEIRWPSGKTEILKDLEAGRFYTVLEGQGVVAPEKIRPNPPAKHP